MNKNDLLILDGKQRSSAFMAALLAASGQRLIHVARSAGRMRPAGLHDAQNLAAAQAKRARKALRLPQEA
jgi:hypothetical protein